MSFFSKSTCDSDLGRVRRPVQRTTRAARCTLHTAQFNSLRPSGRVVCHTTHVLRTLPWRHKRFHHNGSCSVIMTLPLAVKRSTGHGEKLVYISPGTKHVLQYPVLSTQYPTFHIQTFDLRSDAPAHFNAAVTHPDCSAPRQRAPALPLRVPRAPECSSCCTDNLPPNHDRLMESVYDIPDIVS
ncbi:hypothetical protein AB1N83_011867 [Pleurotus pulmonarius]